MTIPPTLTPGTILNALPRPAWWFNFLTTEPLAFASLNSWSGTVAELLDTMFDPTVTYADLTWIKEQWPGKLVVKGIQSVDDARRVTDVGADGLILSNHGCRQLDRAPVPFHLLPEVVREVGHDTEVMLDTGIMNGADIVAACALGARFTLVGRANPLRPDGRRGPEGDQALLQPSIDSSDTRPVPRRGAVQGSISNGVFPASSVSRSPRPGIGRRR
jgi:L-lactate dehydrogenase (cytochrome)